MEYCPILDDRYVADGRCPGMSLSRGPPNFCPECSKYDHEKGKLIKERLLEADAEVITAA